MAAVPAEPRGAAAEPAFSELLAGVRRGEERAFAELHQRLAMPLYRRLLALTRGDEALSRELAQGAMLRLVRRCPPAENEAGLLAWLPRVGRNAWCDQFRRQRREAHLPLADIDPAADVAPDAPVAALLHEILRALPAEEGELLQAAYVDERPLAEIARERGLTYKALEGRLSRLRATVRARLLRLLRHES